MRIKTGRRKYCRKFLALCLAISCSPALAAEVRELHSTDEIGYLTPPYKITLHNAAGQDIYVYLGTEKDNLKKLKLQKDAVSEFSDRKSIQYIIEVPTKGRDGVEYRLSGGERYSIFWNEKKQQWDVETLVQ